jgi:virginiamycin B lyase
MIMRHNRTGGNMRLFSRFFALFIGLVFLVPYSHAATVTGHVKGTDGAPFMGAFVIAQNSQTKMSVNVLSDKDGRYHIDNLPAGKYSFRIRAIGYQSAPQNDVNVGEKQNVSFDFSLQKGTVRWSDISIYQGMQLLPKGEGHDELFGSCFVCHAFQTRMASATRDEEGWRDRVQYMRDTMDLGPRFSDARADKIVKYLTATFGPDSTKPKSPADMPDYQKLVRPFSEQAMNIVYVEYDVTSPDAKGLPWSAAPDKEGNLWMPYYGNGNKVGRLNPKTGEVKFYSLPPEVPSAGVHSAIPVPDGTVWFTEFFLNKIAHLDPKSGQITEYQDESGTGRSGGEEGGGGSKHTIRMDPQGTLWMSGGPFSSFDPETKKFMDYKEVPSTYGVIVDTQGNKWFAVYSNENGAIGRVDAKTGKISQWPTKIGGAQRLQVDSSGMVWFSNRRGDILGRFDPKTETFKSFPLPGPSPSSYALGIDQKNNIWFDSTNQDTINRLDPQTGQVTEYPIPHSEGLYREFFLDPQGRMWYATPTNNRVGYFYLAGSNQSAQK